MLHDKDLKQNSTYMGMGYEIYFSFKHFEHISAAVVFYTDVR